MVSGDDEHASQSQVLANHQSELDDFRITEMFSQFREKRAVDFVKIGCHLFRVSYGEGIARLEFPFRLRKMNLCDRFFVEPLTRRRRVACEESGITFVDLGDLETGELLDARRNDALLMAGSKEREVALEEIRK